jgi:hypothetical protein
MIHNWWQLLNEELLRDSIESAFKEKCMQPPNKGDMNILTAMLWDKLIEYMNAPYDPNAPNNQQHGEPVFGEKFCLTMSSILNHYIYCFEY